MTTGDESASGRSTQFERALRELRSLLLNGDFAIGERMPETALADRLGVSRTPLRQAMDRLVDESLLERLPSGRCVVASFSMADIADAIELRGVLEGTVARLAAERGIDPELAEECERVLDGLDETLTSADRTDFEGYVELNGRFHELLGSLAGSRIIQREVERVGRLPLASPSAFVEGQQAVPDFIDSLLVAQQQHRAIFEAIVAREGSRAESLAREHARLARRNLDLLELDGARRFENVPGMALIAI
jgi:GntR family transcriptional regulator of vanillate catabolism